jgi:hypothetical protein
MFMARLSLKEAINNVSEYGTAHSIDLHIVQTTGHCSVYYFGREHLLVSLGQFCQTLRVMW